MKYTRLDSLCRNKEMVSIYFCTGRKEQEGYQKSTVLKDCRESNPEYARPSQPCVFGANKQPVEMHGAEDLAAKAIEGAALALEGIHDIPGGHSLSASVLGVGHGVTDHVLEKDL